jgi:hypothetical protein
MRDSEVYASILFHGLKRNPIFDKLTSQQFAEIHNGFGPNAWHRYTRKALSWVFGMFPEISGVHDIDHFYSDGTKRGFDLTVKHWRQNTGIMLNARYPLSSPSLYVHRAVAWLKLRAAERAIASDTAYKFYLENYVNLLAKQTPK